MKLLRSREVQSLLLILGAIALLGAAAIALLSLPAAAIFLVCMLLAGAAVLLFTRWRYRKIDELAEYLRRVNTGDYTLDVSGYQEGELSILGSEIYKTTVMLREQNEALQTEQKNLTAALSDISHQLKTPLTSMFVMTDLLMREDLPECRRAEFTDKIRAQLTRLQWLVSSLLKLSKLEAKSVVFHKQAVSAHALIERACQPLLIPMEIKSQTLTVCAGEEALTCDINWTAEALLNILKNCVEHTPQGGEITVSCAQNPFYTRIAIADNGQGIDKADLPHIFDRFYRGKNASDDSVGIGLAMANAIIKGQGGIIHVKSEQGKGTSFVIQL